MYIIRPHRACTCERVRAYIHFFAQISYSPAGNISAIAATITIAAVAALIVVVAVAVAVSRADVCDVCAPGAAAVGQRHVGGGGVERIGSHVLFCGHAPRGVLSTVLFCGRRAVGGILQELRVRCGRRELYARSICVCVCVLF